MNPKKKAGALVLSYMAEGAKYEDAITYSKVFVKEMIDELECIVELHDGVSNSYITYWKDVEKELDKLRREDEKAREKRKKY